MCGYSSSGGGTMSEDVVGFQSQLGALMEMLLKAVVCETTKLFESGVLRLRSEVASIRRENEELKARLRSSENPGDRSRSKKRQNEKNDPVVQLMDSVEDDTSKLSPVVSLKEEGSEVDLVKHEDPDTEECKTDITMDNPKEMSFMHDTSKETVKKRIAHMTTGDDREEVPCETQAASAEGIGESIGQDSTARGPVTRTTLGNNVKMPNSNHLNTEHFPKEFKKQVEECSAGGVCMGFGHKIPEAEPHSGQSVDALDKTADPVLGVTVVEAQKCQYDCSGEVAAVPPCDGPQVQPGGLPCQRSECGRLVNSGSTLEAHQSVHTGERPYTCLSCGKAFPSLRGLNRHSQAHTAKRQHQCLQCGKSFVYRFGLTKHQLIHSGERAHICKVCDKSFVFKSDLTIHMRKHTGETPYGCSICGKMFKHRQTLNLHLQGHTGEKRHICTHCGKSFLDLGNFKKHKRIHTGEKPYSCQVCGKSFTQSAHLKKHFLTHR